MSIQEYLFRRIREKLPHEESLADSIGELLHISPDSAYRRIRGETPLVLSEAQLLCEAYDLSLDQVFLSKDSSVPFTLIQLNNDNYDFTAYLKGIANGLKKLQQANDRQIIYLSKDIPFFHNFHFRPVFAFHYFFWMKSIQQHPRYLDKRFSSDLLTPEMEELGKNILSLYNNIPSIEIWNTESVHSMIAQVEYYREAGHFESHADAEMIYDALGETLDHIRLQAELGCKFVPGESPRIQKNSYELYHNRVVLGDNTILVRLDGRQQVYLNYETLNYMTTTDVAFCERTNDRVHNLMKRSTLLSRVSEKQRNIFFNALLRKIPRHKATNQF